ncbi:hypothetical protein J4Q44_G00379920 [Coregonus suidteri]|uniref:Uncharacterized protein n=1 Tax=Coregonus suidteri TaxID=861788 RepID=A0AAN8QJV9_9TELE
MLLASCLLLEAAVSRGEGMRTGVSQLRLININKLSAKEYYIPMDGEAEQQDNDTENIELKNNEQLQKTQAVEPSEEGKSPNVDDSKDKPDTPADEDEEAGAVESEKASPDTAGEQATDCASTDVTVLLPSLSSPQPGARSTEQRYQKYIAIMEDLKWQHWHDSEVAQQQAEELRQQSQEKVDRKLEAPLHAKEELVEGLHLIDFKQLKIKNQT